MDNEYSVHQVQKAPYNHTHLKPLEQIGWVYLLLPVRKTNIKMEYIQMRYLGHFLSEAVFVLEGNGPRS